MALVILQALLNKISLLIEIWTQRTPAPVQQEAAERQAKECAPPPYQAARSNERAEAPSSSKEARSSTSQGFIWRMFLMFMSDPDAWWPTSETCDWAATMYVGARDVAQLMRNGFYWSEDNVRREDGQVLVGTAVPRSVRARGYKYARIYRLVDLAEQPEWEAELWVYSAKMRTLCEFRLRDIALRQVMLTWAGKSSDQMVYNFSAKIPEYNMNAIYDDMPLKGHGGVVGVLALAGG
ncbi:hypothetical protein FZEAL_8918 [Fusarium zealandicum]|uniref:Uncharacterized protein n=1 Tax=Fusarium zealandicum TaxID=1053134 RepID=A0A8H4UCZ5_9HYPO|nr:hypothetical protein FZEAL_8918 [Fusarium zealandicum]